MGAGIKLFWDRGLVGELLFSCQEYHKDDKEDNEDEEDFDH